MNEEEEDMDSFSVGSSCISESRPSTIVSIECVKRGSTRAYQTKAENINVLQNVNLEKKAKSSFDAGDQIDKVLSGESLYKTFNFEQSSHEEDIEKCIAFWKSVMHKNLEPIKCTIIESTRARASHEEPPMQESLSELERKHAEEIKHAENRVHEFYNTMWNSTLEQIQRRRLDRIKLIGKARCKMCETQISDSKASLTVDKEEIKDLNSWQPQSPKSGSATRVSKPKISIDPTQKSAPVPMPEACICKTPEKSLSVETVIGDRVRIPPDSNRYQLVDLIEKKKRDGTYSRWRKSMTKRCTCGVKGCDCNVNPAIVSMIEAEKTCGCGLAKCHCKGHKEKELSDEEEESLQQVEEAPEVQVPYCTCGHEFCTCNKRDIVTESLTTVEALPMTDVVGDTKDVKSDASKDTLSIKAGQKIPRDFMQQNDIGPIKRDSKADVTKTVIEGDTSSVDIPKFISEPSKCICEGECKCKKAETVEETNEVEKGVLQLQKTNKK